MKVCQEDIRLRRISMAGENGRGKLPQAELPTNFAKAIMP